MTSATYCAPLPRQKIPNDGPGPRGVPDVYYTSRTLNSTFRYARFIKKLRMFEEEQRKGRENNLKELKDQQISDFFIRCDRRSLTNNVARRVDLCMQSYETDLEQKRARLRTMFKKEEEANIREVVVRVQAATETEWQEKMDRLQYLLEKRRKEHEEKYKDPPLEKCTHVKPCIVKLRQKEAQEMQLYQIQEKEAMRMQEREFDKMWIEVAMKECDALSARMEMDAIDRYRRDMECKNYSDMILAQREKQRALDRERLKQEQIEMQAKFDADMKKEQEDLEKKRLKRLEVAQERKEQLEVRHATLAKQKEADDLIENAWASLQGQGLAEEKAKIALIRRKRMDLDECNRRMIELRKLLENDNADEMLKELARAQQDVIDRKRCDYQLWSQKTNRDCRKAMMEQIADHAKAREDLEKRLKEEDEYHTQLRKQLEELVALKSEENARARKHMQSEIRKQIDYNKLIKERAWQEELEQRKKAEIAAREYQEELGRMLCRPFFSDEIHPFMKQMVNLKQKNTCPCSKQTWCQYKK